MTESENVIEELWSLEEFGIKGFLMPPADRDELNSVLYDEIPEDYKEFLALANGAQAPGLLLLGTVPQTLAGGQVEPDIISTTMDARSWDSFGDSNVALGHLTGNLLLIYNGTEKRYEVLDKSNYEAVFKFNSLFEVVHDWSERTRQVLEMQRNGDSGTTR